VEGLRRDLRPARADTKKHRSGRGLASDPTVHPPGVPPCATPIPRTYAYERRERERGPARAVVRRSRPPRATSRPRAQQCCALGAQQHYSLRRGRESNPRKSFPFARLASGYHRPLGHLSGARLSGPEGGLRGVGRQAHLRRLFAGGAVPGPEIGDPDGRSVLGRAQGAAPRRVPARRDGCAQREARRSRRFTAREPALHDRATAQHCGARETRAELPAMRRSLSSRAARRVASSRSWRDAIGSQCTADLELQQKLELARHVARWPSELQLGRGSRLWRPFRAATRPLVPDGVEQWAPPAGSFVVVWRAHPEGWRRRAVTSHEADLPQPSVRSSARIVKAASPSEARCAWRAHWPQSRLERTHGRRCRGGELLHCC
jgi:hypothetical protein